MRAVQVWKANGETRSATGPGSGSYRNVWSALALGGAEGRKIEHGSDVLAGVHREQHQKQTPQGPFWTSSASSGPNHRVDWHYRVPVTGVDEFERHSFQIREPLSMCRTHNLSEIVADFDEVGEEDSFR